MGIEGMLQADFENRFLNRFDARSNGFVTDERRSVDYESVNVKGRKFTLGIAYKHLNRCGIVKTLCTLLSDLFTSFWKKDYWNRGWGNLFKGRKVIKIVELTQIEARVNQSVAAARVIPAYTAADTKVQAAGIPNAQAPSSAVVTSLKDSGSSDLSPESFLAPIYANVGRSYGIKTNCSKMSEVQAVFLGEKHQDKDDYQVNSEIARQMVKEGDLFYNEAGKGREAASISTDKLSPNIEFRCWDSKPPKIDHAGLCRIAGFIFQRIIEIVNKQVDCAKTIREIEEDLKKVSEYLESLNNRSLVCNNEEYEDCKSELNEINENSFVHLFNLYAKAVQIFNFSSCDVLSWIEKNHLHRQNDLVRAVAHFDKNRVFVSAGTDHLIAENDEEIEKTLNEHLVSSKIKYLIVFPKNSQPENSDRIKNKIIHQPTRKIDDFRKLPPSFFRTEVVNLCLKKQDECGKLFACLKNVDDVYRMLQQVPKPMLVMTRAELCPSN